jgi:hypothetical protein
MLRLETREQLEELYQLQIQESLTLEYKASDAIRRTEGSKDELARDVSALANAAGGQIVYGMTEQDHAPAGLDAGLDRASFPGLWFEQVLQAKISPTIEGLAIREIPLEENRIAVVITVPPAGARAPHQASDGRYYRRRNFQRTHMEDYEVREAMRRHVQPEPFLEIGFDPDPALILWDAPETHSNPIQLIMRVGNRSREPALYTHIGVYIDADMVLTKKGTNESHNTRLSDGTAVNAIFFKLVVPYSFPLFKERMFTLGDGTMIAIAPNHRDTDLRYPIMYELSTPGYSFSRSGAFLKQNDRLRLVWAP